MKRRGTAAETRRGPARLAVGLVSVAALAACGGGARSGGVVVRDSAGVRIVEISAPEAPAPGDPARWTVGEPVALMGIGERDGFGLIAGVAVLGDGTVAVADAHAGEVRFFGPLGRPLARAGRRGEGPGEFEAIEAIWRTPGDSVGVWDARFGRFTIIAPDGGIGPTVALEATAERARHTPLGPLPDGRLLARSDARTVPGLEYYRAELSVLAFGTDGRVADTLARVPGREMWDWIVERGTVPSSIPFGAETWMDVTAEALYIGTNEGYAFERYDLGGRRVESVRMERAPTPVSPADVEAYKQAERDKATSSIASKGGNDIFGAIAEDAPYPDHYPYYEGLVVDDVGNVWLRDYPSNPAAPARLTVFGPDGAPLGTAELPSAFRPVEIRDGRVTGIWRDELDREHVRVYELRDGGTPGG